MWQWRECILEVFTWDGYGVAVTCLCTCSLHVRWWRCRYDVIVYLQSSRAVVTASLWRLTASLAHWSAPSVDTSSPSTACRCEILFSIVVKTKTISKCLLEFIHKILYRSMLNSKRLELTCFYIAFAWLCRSWTGGCSRGHMTERCACGMHRESRTTACSAKTTTRKMTRTRRWVTWRQGKWQEQEGESLDDLTTWRFKLLKAHILGYN